MNAGTVFGSDVVRKGITFPRLNVRDYGSIENAMRTERAERLTAQLSVVKLDPEQQFNSIRNADAFPVTWVDVQRHMATYEGSTRVMRKSLEKAKTPKDDIDAALDLFTVIEASNLAMELLGFSRQDENYVALMEVWDTLSEAAKIEVVKAAKAGETKPQNPR